MVQSRRFERSLSRLGPRTFGAALLVVALAGIVPGVVVLAATVIRDRAQHAERDAAVNLDMARIVAAAFEGYVLDARRELTGIAGLAGAGALSVGQAQTWLEGFTTNRPGVVNALWIDQKGRIVAAAGPDREDVAAALAPWRDQALATGHVVTDLFPVGAGRQPRLALVEALPLRGGGTAGVIAAVLEPDALGDAVLPGPNPPDLVLAVRDRLGRLVVRRPALLLSFDERVNPFPAADRLRAGEPVKGRVQGTDGEWRLGAAAPTPSLGFVASAVRPEVAALASLRNRVWLDVAGLALVVVLGGLVAIAVASMLRRRVEVLTSHVAALGRGERTALDSLGLVELDRLATAFDVMAQRVAVREAALQLARTDVDRNARDAWEQTKLLERLHDRREDLVRMTAHDLRAPLSAIDLQLESLEDRDDEARHNAVARIRRATRRMSALVDDMLDLSLAASGRLSLALERVDLARYLPEVIASHDGGIASGRVNVVVERVPPVLVDVARLDRAVMNLVTNALKYSPPGSQVRVSLGVDHDGPVIAVADDGPGIAPEDVPHVFDRHWRARDASAVQPGQGLGLAIAHLVAVAHGGRITVESARGRGTVFRLHLSDKLESQQRSESQTLAAVP
jgi:two-component system sensor histidine kinase BaeS